MPKHPRREMLVLILMYPDADVGDVNIGIRADDCTGSAFNI